LKFEIYQKLYKRRFSWSFGVQVAEVAVKVLKVTLVNDLGTVINRQIVEGRSRGRS
jgi:CO/xanthine dehydrogenase Mo-binding subunit